MSKVQHRSPWDIDGMDDLFDDCAAAKGNAASLTAKISAMDTAIAGKQDALTFDDAPESGSSNPVKSSGIYTALSGKATPADITSAIGALNAASVGGTGKYISAISETGGVISATASQIDSVPTENSTNPVTSGGVYTPISADRAALVELVDSGAKNLSQWNAGTGSGTIGSGIPFTTSGNLVISFQSDASTGYITLGFKNASDDPLLVQQINNSGTKIQEVAIPSGVAYFNIVSSLNANYSNFMICTKASWDISHAFQPYRPSYQELYEMVLARS